MDVPAGVIIPFDGNPVHLSCCERPAVTVRLQLIDYKRKQFGETVWHPLAEAQETVSYDNAREVLVQAAEMQQALVQT